MKESEKQYFEDLLIKAIQATKSENSGLIGDLKKEIQSVHDKFDTFTKEDHEWKEDAKPIIDMGKNLKGFGKVLMYIIYVIAALGGVILTLRTVFKDVKQ